MSGGRSDIAACQYYRWRRLWATHSGTIVPSSEQSPWTSMGLAGQLGTQPTHSPHSTAAIFVHAPAPAR